MDQNILFIDACVRNNSRTRRLARYLLNRLGGDYVTESLEELKLSPFTGEMLDERTKLLDNRYYTDKSFDPARRFSAADIIVIAAPYWDLSFPANLKAYIEHIMVNGITFTYTAEGIPKGLCRADMLYYVCTAGGPVIPSNSGYEYISSLAKLYWGIGKTKLFQVENLDVFGSDPEDILRQAEMEMESIGDGSFGERARMQSTELKMESIGNK